MTLPRPSRRIASALSAGALAFGIIATATPAASQPARPAKAADKKPAKKKKAAATAAATPAAPKPPPLAAKEEAPLALALEVQRSTLPNGLRVVLNPDHATPTVAVAVTYDVGSRDDQPDRTGFAHLFEHMMFEGSKNVPKGEHARLVTSHGGTLNATTDVDRTNYYEMVPANELALALWLEADRMKALGVTEEAFETQRKVVQEEYRMRYSNVPYRLSTLRLDELVYQGYWPYEHSTIGSMKDLEAAAFANVSAFHARHYAPNSAVLSIAGDFEPAEAMALVTKYFGPIARVDAAPFEDPKLPEQTSQRTAVVRDEHARSAMVQYGWAVPPNRAPDHYALEVAALLLGSGESSRLHQLLVKGRAVAQSAWAGTRDRRGPDLFTVGAKLAEGAAVGDVEKLVEGEIKALSTRAPPAAEVAKAKRRIESDFIFGLTSNFARATKLGQYELFFGDATLLNGELAKYFAVTPEDVKRVAAQYLGPTKRSIVETYPPDRPGDKKPAAAPAPPPKAAKKATEKADKKKKKAKP